MEINLQYRGEIPSEQGGAGDRRIDVKQAIRLEFSDQLRRRWRDSQALSKWYLRGLPTAAAGRWERHWIGGDDLPEHSPFFKVQSCGFSVIPLVSWHNGLTCELEIVFTGDERSVISRGGDLDNRLKIVFDALRMPLHDREVPGSMFGKGGVELYVLVEDDSLIRKFSVEAIQSPYSPPEYDLRVRARLVGNEDSHSELIGIR